VEKLGNFFSQTANIVTSTSQLGERYFFVSFSNVPCEMLTPHCCCVEKTFSNSLQLSSLTTRWILWMPRYQQNHFKRAERWKRQFKILLKGHLLWLRLGPLPYLAPSSLSNKSREIRQFCRCLRICYSTVAAIEKTFHNLLQSVVISYLIYLCTISFISHWLIWVYCVDL
jgi:hypothetical protein